MGYRVLEKCGTDCLSGFMKGIRDGHKFFWIETPYFPVESPAHILWFEHPLSERKELEWGKSKEEAVSNVVESLAYDLPQEAPLPSTEGWKVKELSDVELETLIDDQEDDLHAFCWYMWEYHRSLVREWNDEAGFEPIKSKVDENGRPKKCNTEEKLVEECVKEYGEAIRKFAIAEAARIFADDEYFNDYPPSRYYGDI